MIKTLLSSLFAVFLFAAGAVGAWYFVQFQEQQAQQAASEAGGPDTTTAMTSAAPMGVSGDGTTSDPSSAGSNNPMKGHLAAPVRNATLSPEERFRWGVLNGDQIAELKRREDALQEQESRLALVHEDLNQQKQEVEGILTQVKTYVAKAEELLSMVTAERAQLKTEKEQNEKQIEELKNAKSVPTEVEKKNVKKVAELLAGMDSASAAKVLKQLANEGDMSYALEVLDAIEQRNASKILDAMEDTALQAEFTAQYRKLPRDPAPNRR